MGKVATVFRPGAYGFFISWCVYTFSNLNSNDIISPIDENNSGHLFNNDPGILECAPLHNFKEGFENYLLLTYNPTKTLNYFNNHYEKFSSGDIVEFLSTKIPNYQENLIDGWPDDSIWGLRELLSFYLPALTDALVSEAESEKQRVIESNVPYYIADPEDLLTNSEVHLEKIYLKFGLEKNQHFIQLPFYTNLYLTQQKYFNKQQELDNFVNCVIDNSVMEISSTTILDEAYIQYKLRVHNYEIKCHNLNKFPTHSVELKKITYCA